MIKNCFHTFLFYLLKKKDHTIHNKIKNSVLQFHRYYEMWKYLTQILVVSVLNEKYYK